MQLPLSFEKKRGKGRGLDGCAQAIPRLLNASTRGTSTFDLVLTTLENERAYPTTSAWFIGPSVGGAST